MINNKLSFHIDFVVGARRNLQKKNKKKENDVQSLDQQQQAQTYEKNAKTNAKNKMGGEPKLT